MNKLHHLGTQVLEVEDFILRPFIKEDLDEFHIGITNDKEVQKYFLIPYMENMLDTQHLLNQIIKQYSKKTYNWVISSNDTHQFIGIIRLFDSNEESCFGELGYALSKKYWNQGIATKVLKKVIDFLLNEVGYHRLFAGVMKENEASKKVLIKAGMKYEGIRYQEIYWQNKYHDVEYYYILSEAYKTL